MSFSRAAPSSAGEPRVVAHREAVADGARDRHPELRAAGVITRRSQAADDREPGAHREAVDERDRRLAHGLEPVRARASIARLVDEPVLGAT